MAAMADPDLSHWERWHRAYEDPASPLSVRLALVQAELRAALDGAPPGPIRVVSLCAGQGRDVIDVVAGHGRRADVEALLVELDPGLVAFARARAEAAGVAGSVRVVEGDASQCSWYAPLVPAHVVLVCGVFGNLSDDDVAATVAALPGFCAPGASVIWTRHRRPPDRTPDIRRWFVEAGFEHVAFEAPPAPYVLAVGRERLVGPVGPFDPGRTLFAFIGDGSLPA
jgi:Putative methyltransferase